MHRYDNAIRSLCMALAVGAAAFLSAVLVDVAKVASALMVAPQHTFGAWATGVSLGVRFMPAVLAYAVFSACLLPLLSSVRAAGEQHATRWPARALFALHDLAAFSTCAAVYLTLGAYTPFLTFVPAIAALVVIALALCGVFRLALRPAAPRWVRRTVMFGGVLGFVTLAAADRWVFPGLYPTMHLAFVQLSVLCAFVAVSPMLLSLRARLSLRALVGAASVVVMLSALAVYGAAFAEVSPESSSMVRSVTSLGQAPEALGVATARRTSHTVAIDGGHDAEGYFVSHCGLPKLPEGTRLGDYDVLLITIEATRYDYTSLANPKEATTPNLLAFAKSGAFHFTRAYSPSSGTLHSMSALHAMSFPSSLALQPTERPWWGTLAQSETTVAELFSKTGRETFWVSHDVDDVFSKRRIQGLEQGFDPKNIWHGRKNVATADKLIATEAIRKLHEVVKRKRYFGWVFFESPHARYFNHERGKKRGDGSAVERYRSELTYADAQVGKVIQSLRESGALEHTIVIIAGDHGEEFGDHGGTRHKATVFSEVTHVPLLVWVPGMKGKRMSTPTSMTYLFPWLLRTGAEAAREGALKRIGNTLVPMMRATDNAVVSELIGHDRMFTTLVYDRYKLNYNVFADHTEVFDLETDPGEHNDILIRGSEPARALLPHLENYLNLRHTLARFTLPDVPDKKAPAAAPEEP